MKLKRPCKNPRDNPDCEGLFRPTRKERLCNSCFRFSPRRTLGMAVKAI